MKQDHWIDLNIHQLKYKQNEKNKQKGTKYFWFDKYYRERESLVCGVLSLAKRSKLLFILFIFMKIKSSLWGTIGGGGKHPSPPRVTQYTKL